MPLISAFYGVLVYMYFIDVKQHHLPHIHVQYAGDEAIFAIESGDVIDGSIPKRQLRLVQAWVELHREELLVDWQLAVNGRPTFKIDPLR